MASSKELSVIKYMILLSQDTNPLRNCSLDVAMMLLKSHLGPILFNIFINDTPKINSLHEITTCITISADDVQLLFSGTPNNLEHLKMYAVTRLKTMKEWYSKCHNKVPIYQGPCSFDQHSSTNR